MTRPAAPADTVSPGMVAAGVENEVSRRSAVYWRDLVFGRVLPAIFFSIFLVRYLLTVWDGLHSIRQPSDYLFVVQQALALAYFTMLVILYSVRLPKRGTDHRLGVIFIAFSGTFSVLVAGFLPGGVRRDWLVLPADVIATVGLAYSVWGLAVLYFIACELLRMRWEEGVLSRAFPADYPDYAREVPRYAPNPFRKRG